MAPPDSKRKSKLRSQSGSSPDNNASDMNETILEVETPDATDKLSAKALKTQKKEECPCLQSLGVYWLICQSLGDPVKW